MNSFYATNGHRDINNKITTLRIHRLIMNCPDDKIIDHINHNTLDNRKSNLRICTHLENNRNSKKRKDGLSSQYKGVTHSKKTGKFIAQINIKNKRKRIGQYNTELEATIAYNEHAKKFYGEFANLNIINWGQKWNQKIIE